MYKPTQEEINDFEFGIYEWHDVNGKIVANDELEPMIIASRKGDQTKIAALRKAAERFGIVGGAAHWEPGVRPCSVNEWERQRERMANGEQPDPYNLPELIDDMKSQRELSK